MSRSKAILTAFLCLCLPLSSALAQSENLISDELIKTETVNYSKTAVVEESVYQREFGASAAEYYPYTYALRAEVDNASFAQYHVARRQEVKAGDVLVTFTLEIDEEALASSQLSLERTQQAYESGKTQKNEEIAELLENLKQLKDAAQREVMTLRIKRAQVAYEQYCYQQETKIAALKEQLAEMEEENRQTQLIAPCDGVITDLTYKRAGERVYADEVLVTLYREEGMLLRISNDDLRFRYGMEVTVTSGNKKDPTHYKGRVVAADNQLPSSRRLGHAFIQLELPEGDMPRLSRLSVNAASQYLENVMVIPRKAATMDGGKYYVECLVNGSVQKRFVNIGLTNTANTWILQGLQPGDTVIID